MPEMSREFVQVRLSLLTVVICGILVLGFGTWPPLGGEQTDLGAPGEARPPAPAGPPSILLVTLDTVRADRIGAYGHGAGTTPHIDRLAREGVLFEAAQSAAPVTLPSHASILSGVAPPVHGVRDNGSFVVPPETTLVSEVLQEHGWRTGAFVGSYVLDPRFGLDQGFEVYGPAPLSAPGFLPVDRRPADAVVGEALAWLEQIGPEERFFAWVHLYDPHRPWLAPQPWSERFEDPYDAEIAFGDDQLGRLLEGLEHRGLDRNLLVVVTADHGESLGEHGESSHGAFVYQATQHVPLVFWGAPVAKAAGARPSQPVSNAAVAPTLLELAGLAGTLPAVRGGSLLRGDGTPAPDSGEPVYLENYMTFYSCGWRALRGLIWRGYKLVDARTPELYDLASDPHEQADLAASRPETVAELRQQLAAVEAAFVPGRASLRRLDPAERELLQGLGYVQGGFRGNPLDPALPDPRERQADRQLQTRASGLVVEAVNLRGESAAAAWQRHEHEERAREKLVSARALLERMLARSPRDVLSLLVLGDVERLLGEWQAASETLERVLRLNPSHDLAHFNLGVAYFEAGRPEEGLREMRRAIELAPEASHYALELARYNARAGDYRGAERWLDRASDLTPSGSPQRSQIEGLARQLEASRASAS